MCSVEEKKKKVRFTMRVLGLVPLKWTPGLDVLDKQKRYVRASGVGRLRCHGM